MEESYLQKKYANAWQFIREAGLKGIGKIIKVVLLFSVLNIGLFIWGVVKVIGGSMAGVWLWAMALVGIGLTIYAGYRAYKFAINNALSNVYGSFRGELETACEAVIKKVSDPEVDNDAFDFLALIKERFENLPGIVKKLVEMVIDRIPVVGVVADSVKDLDVGDVYSARDNLYAKVDGHFTQYFKSNTNTNFVWWVLLLNVGLLVGLVLWQTGVLG
ncbi:MAG: hypothetical protein H6607_06490 [Flavobacteriales bacterium]|nr:hypothetical protein [Flavobacteriales bacterium]